MVDRKPDFDRTLGERIRAAREEAGVKQDQLAGAVGLSRTSITNIERGRQGVQAYLLVRIAEVLGQAAADLLPGSGPPRPGSLPEKMKSLEPSQREWAKRVLNSPSEQNEDAT